MREASVYVGTSRYESFPLPPLEAMASGTPVVSTANDGMLAYAHDGENCLLVPVDDAEALLAATRRVLDDAALAEALRAAGLKTAARFGWDAIAADLLDDFQSLVAALPCAVSLPLEIDLEGLEFDDAADRDQLAQLAAACPYERFAIPVAQPAHGDFRLVRWRTVAHRAGGFPGTGRGVSAGALRGAGRGCRLSVRDRPSTRGPRR